MTGKRNRTGFTLVELLVVIGIMGLLGTISVGGYRAMQRGMEERGVMQNANAFIRTAYERAQIDRQPTAVFFWNETLREATEDENEIVVGRAVAVRSQGRISRVDGGDLVDEFADLDKTYSTESTSSGSGRTSANTMYLYLLDSIGSSDVKLERSIVSTLVTDKSKTEIFLEIGGLPTDAVTGGDAGKIPAWAFKMINAGGASWKKGSRYGIEFAEITLAHNYIFGSAYSKKIDTPVKDAGTMVFGLGSTASGSGSSGGSVGGSGNVAVYSLRPDGSGGLRAEKVASIERPQ